MLGMKSVHVTPSDGSKIHFNCLWKIYCTVKCSMYRSYQCGIQNSTNFLSEFLREFRYLIVDVSEHWSCFNTTGVTRWICDNKHRFRKVMRMGQASFSIIVLKRVARERVSSVPDSQCNLLLIIQIEALFFISCNYMNCFSTGSLAIILVYLRFLL